jgi:hypothetical protein
MVLGGGSLRRRSYRTGLEDSWSWDTASGDVVRVACRETTPQPQPFLPSLNPHPTRPTNKQSCRVSGLVQNAQKTRNTATR